jgi:dsDNA-binding SOS-regulon protein
MPVRRLKIQVGKERSIEFEANAYEKMLTIKEQLDEEIETCCMSFDEAYKMFNLVLDSIQMKSIS